MSLKRPLYATGTDGDQSQNGNLWPDDDPRVRARRSVPHMGTTNTAAYNGTDFSYQDELISSGAFGGPGPDIMFDGSFDLSSTPFFDSSQQQLFLGPPSGSNAFSNTSYTSTPVGFTTDGDESADVDMRDADMADDSNSELICYGVIINERVRLVGKGATLQEKIVKLKESSINIEPGRPQSFSIERSTENSQLFLIFPDGTKFGYLSKKMTEAMDGLWDVLRLDLEAFAPLNEIGDAVLRAAKAVDAKFRANINIYGLEASRDRVGRALSSGGLFLQAPDVWRRGVRYDNPQMLRMEGMEDSEAEEVEEVEEEEEEVEEVTEEEAGETVEDPPEINQDFDDTMARIFGSLQRQNDLHRVEGGENLSSTLYEHQEQALDFMIQRETGNISEDYRLWKPKMVAGEQMFCHVIVPSPPQREMPDESGGGILADEMGMGKSLTMLVLIGKTMRDARQWAEEEKALPDAALSERPCRATLVIVPSRVLITTWTREIERHLNGSLDYLLYHGRARSESVNKIEEKDIVITTYNTLAKEHSAKLLGQGKSPLHEIKWHRIVLDEAHWIRRRETTFHKAVTELSAKSRWCLSGTPIQNSLADLASLLVFIQVRPFQTQRHFRYHISQPFEDKARKQMAIQRLTDLLEAICLRRTIERANLPKPQEETRTVIFTPEEREQYRLTNADMERYFAQQPSEYKERASAFGMFQIFLQLRSFCNHGTYQPRFSWAKRNFLDQEADDVRSLTRTSWDRCLGCRQPLPIITREQPQYVEKCGHVLCEDCCKGSNRVRADGRKHCPLCESLRNPHWNNAHDSGFLHKEGYSSKMQALIEDVQKDIDTTQSIIFSCWTRTLDLIGKHLRRARVPFARIDGKTPSGSRQSTLDSFDSTRSVPVLIMTTGTGAFGLNLQSVNRVFIVEPQWNPSVESQAVARAIRLGQHQQVRVIRYRVDNSIEERMYTQQANKQTLSKMEFGRELLAGQQEDSEDMSIIDYQHVPSAD